MRLQQTYLDNHAEVQDLLSSLLPTLLTSGLMLLIPILLLLIAKKAHTINTLSALHDLILTRYHKFLVANILVFFCVGVTALESFFTSFKNSLDILSVVGESFPLAGPFYVGWSTWTRPWYSYSFILTISCSHFHNWAARWS